AGAGSSGTGFLDPDVGEHQRRAHLMEGSHRAGGRTCCRRTAQRTTASSGSRRLGCSETGSMSSRGIGLVQSARAQAWSSPGPMNITDYLVIAAIIISAVVGSLRGFLRE